MKKPKLNPAEHLALLRTRVGEDREEMLAHTLAYGETDLLFYRAQEPELAERQRAHFDPILNALYDAFGITCRITQHVAPIAQDAASQAKIRALYEAAGDKELAALALMVPLLGSALLALALWKKLATLEEVLASAHLDEAWQAERWAEDPAEQASWAAKVAQIREAAAWLV